MALYRLYIIGCDEQKKRLTEFVQSQTSMINNMIEHEIADHPKMKKTDIEKEVLNTLIKAHSNFNGFGKTGELTLAKLDNDQIHFLLSHRHNGIDGEFSVFNTNVSEPMQLALNGKLGSIVGSDYRGVMRDQQKGGDL